MASYMHNLNKLVFSKTLKTTTWQNSQIANGRVESVIQDLKSKPGKNMVILGSANLASTFINSGLIDQYQFLLNPILLGKGNSGFPGLTERHELKPVHTKVRKSGLIELFFEDAREAANSPSFEAYSKF